ncbi:MAG: DNA topoisomerase VI subunit B [Candidatus Anstonellales archaeon]
MTSNVNNKIDNKIEQHFREYAVTEFFRKNRQMLGLTGKVRTLTTIVHEYVTNSLDACEEHGILPSIKVEIKELGEEHYKVVVSDNGPGIPEHLIGKALGQMLAGTKFHRHIQQRGQQGIGAAGCTMLSLLTTGKQTHVISGNGETTISCDLSIDIKSNKPIISNLKKESGTFKGLIVEAEFKEVKYDKSAYGPFEYIRRSAIANPHASFIFKGPDGQQVVFSRTSDSLPAIPKEVKPHPLGIAVQDLIDMAAITQATKLSSFFTNEFSRFSNDKVKELHSITGIDMSKKPSTLSREEAEEIIKAFKKMKWIAPQQDVLSSIGREQLEASLKKILKPELFAVVERPVKILYGGIPYKVEVAIAYGGEIKDNQVMRYANKVPLLFDAGACAITQALKNVDWKRYGIDNFEQSPINLLISIVSTHVPYTSAGKQAISAEEEIVDEIKNAIYEAARNVKQHITDKKKIAEHEKRKKAFLRYVKQLSSDLSILSGYDKSKIEQKLLAMIEKNNEVEG